MADRPILFKGEMVRAILDGRKTQTRRIVKAPKLHPDYGYPHWDEAYKDGGDNDQYLHIPFSGDAIDRTVHRAYCQYEVGDRLWVRETMYCKRQGITPYYDVRYSADDRDFDNGHYLDEWFEGYRNWYTSGKAEQVISAIHMKKEVARIWLEITGIRVERVQEISGEDAYKEGVWIGGSKPKTPPAKYQIVKDFTKLWDPINPKHGWEANPYVWVVEFRKVK